MAVYKKTTTEKTTTSGGSDSFPKAYMRLRTVLDALQINALRYCLEDTKAAERKRRAAEIEAWIMPVIEKLTNEMIAPGNPGDCGDGYHNCGGVCVPYQCPLTSR